MNQGKQWKKKEQSPSATPRCPFCAASCKAVSSAPFEASIWAPASSKSRRTSTCPCRAAWRKAVSPQLSSTLGLRGCFSNTSRAKASLFLAANMICSSSSRSGGKSPTELGPPSPQPSPKFHHLESHRHHLPGRVFVWTCWRQFQLPRLTSLPFQSFLQNLRGQTM